MPRRPADDDQFRSTFDLLPLSDEDEKLPWRFFLGTGFRESEVSAAEATDVDPIAVKL